MFRKPKGIGTCPRNATAKDEGNLSRWAFFNSLLGRVKFLDNERGFGIGMIRFITLRDFAFSR